MKLYYKKKNGYLCDRYPTNLESTEEDPFIDIEASEAQETYVCPYGKTWAVLNGKLQIVDNTEMISSEEYKEQKKSEELINCKRYLSSTDYVISKLNELKLDDDGEYEKAREEYAEVLKKRKEARKRINELEGG